MLSETALPVVQGEDTARRLVARTALIAIITSSTLSSTMGGAAVPADGTREVENAISAMVEGGICWYAAAGRRARRSRGMDGRVESLRTRLCGAPRRRQARILIGTGTLPRGARRKMFARGVGGRPRGQARHLRTRTLETRGLPDRAAACVDDGQARVAPSRFSTCSGRAREEGVWPFIQP